MIPRIQVNAEISFVNLIDVMLVLLIIFMITAPTMHQMIDVELPKGKASRANITEGIVITIKENGTILIDRDKLESKDFLNRFQSVWKKRSGEPVYINADLKVSYGAVVDILSIVKEIGGENVG
ncbi:MAG: biopolymer transporter ExbD, partial [Candidatus Heimdallarchaeota archaeon]|nr:biopolymer transporter ExbD [Candidatus Heimdallarchaeota archaeon]